jgi:hypothetical protein
MSTDGYDLDPNAPRKPTATPPANEPAPADAPPSSTSPGPGAAPSTGQFVSHAAATTVEGVKTAAASIQSGVAKTIASAKAGEGPLCTPAFPGPKVLVVFGLILLACAMAWAGANAYEASRQQTIVALAAGAGAGFEGALHTGTGVLAIVLAAAFLRRPVGRLDLAAPRVLLCFAVMLLILQVRVPIQFLGPIITWGLALLAYWAGVLLLFRRTVDETNVIVAIHIGLFALLRAGMALSAYVSAATAAAPAIG